MSNERQFIICDLAEGHRVDAFECGNPDLDFHIRELAKDQHKTRCLKTLVAVDEAYPEVVMGFVSFRMGCLDAMNTPFAPPAKKVKNHRLSIDLPVVYITNLGVHFDARKQGIGRNLLYNVYLSAKAASDYVACLGVYLASSDDIGTLSFYDAVEMPKLFEYSKTKRFASIEFIDSLPLGT